MVVAKGRAAEMPPEKKNTKRFLTHTAGLGPEPPEKKNTKRFLTHTAGLEPARAEPNRFLVYRLNHSATCAVA